LLKHILTISLISGDKEENEILLDLDEIQGQLQLHDYKLNLMAKQIARLDMSRATLPQAQVPLDEGQPSTQS
jgi:hypothetical protein